MARETKQERIVRSMFDQTSEHIHELKTLAANPGIKELDVERWCQSILKNCLGYTATDGYSILAQESRGKMRPDLVVSKGGKPIFVVEVKKLGYDLTKSDLRSGKIQLSEYLHQIGDVRWGILCNGYEWKLFDFSDPTASGIEVFSFDVRSDADELDLTRKGIEEVCWELYDIHESTCASEAWEESSKEATAFSPESLAKAILSINVVKVIAREIRGEHEYKANVESLIEKVQNLVEKGLDDCVKDWNEVRQLELNKFVKSQKRAGRKRRKVSPKADPAPMTSIENLPGPTSPEAAAPIKVVA